MNKSKRSDGQPRNSSVKIPGRIYTFLCTLLAVFVLGLTGVAFQSLQIQQPAAAKTTSLDSSDTQTVAASYLNKGPDELRITQAQLHQLGAVALGIALLSLLPSRRASKLEEGLTAASVAEQTGLTVVGSVLSKRTSSRRSVRRSSRLLQGFVQMCEMILCTAFTLTVAACLIHPELVRVLQHDPLAGYVRAIHFMSATVNAWVNPSLALT